MNYWILMYSIWFRHHKKGMQIVGVNNRLQLEFNFLWMNWIIFRFAYIRMLTIEVLVRFICYGEISYDETIFVKQINE